MKRFLLSLAVLALAAPAFAQSDFSTYESVNVTASAVGLTSTTYRPTNQPQMQSCLGRLETAEVRYRVDGVDPTSAEGMLLEPGDLVPLMTNAEMAAVRFIRTTGLSGTLKVTCWRVQRPVAADTNAIVAPLPTGTNALGTVAVTSDIPGTGNTNTGKAEDAVHTSGDTGIELLGVRKDTATQSTNADGDYTAPSLDAYGAQFVRSDHPNRIACTVAVSTATTIQAVGGSCATPGAGFSIYITDIEFGSSAASGTAADSFPTLKSGTGGTCGTATAVIWQALSIANSTQVANYTTPRKVTANSEVCWIMTTAGSKTVQINGYIAP